MYNPYNIYKYEFVKAPRKKNIHSQARNSLKTSISQHFHNAAEADHRVHQFRIASDNTMWFVLDKREIHVVSQ